MNSVSLDVDVATAHRLVSEGQARILDVREDDEWQAGHIEGSLHIPLAQLGGRTKEIDKTVTWLALCRSGSRSDRATDFLRDTGLDVRNITGGLRAWAAAELEFVGHDGAPGEVI